MIISTITAQQKTDIPSHTQNEIDTLENNVLYHYYPCQWGAWACAEFAHIDLWGLEDYRTDYEQWLAIRGAKWEEGPTMDQCWEAARYGIFDPLQWSLWTCEEYSDAELQALIDAIPSYWMEYHFDDETVVETINNWHLICIGGEETTEGIYDWIKYYINWIDGSLWSYTYCCDMIDGPAQIGCNPPPEHRCAFPSSSTGECADDISW